MLEHFTLEMLGKDLCFKSLPPIEPGDYRCVTEPIHTLGDWTCTIVRKNLPNDLVHAVNKALWEDVTTSAA